MLKYLTKYLAFINKNIIIDNISIDNNISRKKSQAYFQEKIFKFKNIRKPNFLIKSKLLAKPSFKQGFSIPKIRLGFEKLRQVLFEVLIFYYYN